MIVGAWAQDHVQLLLVGMVCVCVVVGLAAALSSADPHRKIGRGWLDASDLGPDDEVDNQSARSEEIRQMLEARAARRNEDNPLEVETELIMLDALAVTPQAYTTQPEAGSASGATPARSASDKETASAPNRDRGWSERHSGSPVPGARASVPAARAVGCRQRYCPLRRFPSARNSSR